MTNAPFRAAFWTMCCAFLLSFAMVVSSPEAGQFVTELLHPELSRQAAEIVVPKVVLGEHQQFTVPVALNEQSGTDVLVPDPYSQPLDSNPETHSAAAVSPWPAVYSPPPTTSVRTASSDPNVVLGMIEEQAPVATREKSSSDIGPVTTPPIEIVTAAETGPKDIPVPAPQLTAPSNPALLTPDLFPEPDLKRLQGSVTQLRMAQIERELAEVRSQERGKLQRIAEGELTEIQDRLKEFRSRFAPESNGALVDDREPADAPVLMTLAENGEASSLMSRHEESPFAEGRASADSTLTVSETAETGRFDISIQDTDVGEVLRQLGRRLGWRVIISPEVTGQFTGEFHEADIEQAFVMVVKTHQLGVDRRGDYILIRPRSGR